MKTKICLRCNVEKEITEYYVHKQMADGHLNICKTCKRADAKNNTDTKKKDPNWVEKEKERGRNKYRRLYKGIKIPTEVKRKAIQKYNEKYPEKYKARIYSGKIKVPKGLHAHHWSYNDEHMTDVIFINIQDHYTAHRFMVYDQERMMYRGLDGILLDTKQAHIDYINKYITNKI